MKRTIIVCVACVAAMISCGEGRNAGIGAVAGEVAQAADGITDGVAEVAGGVAGTAGWSAETLEPEIGHAAAGTGPLSLSDISIEKKLLYDQYTLADKFPYKDGEREFQFDKIRDRLFMLDSIQQPSARWGILQNRKNVHGQPPNTKRFTTNEYHSIADLHGVERRQSAPLYTVGEFGHEAPERYGRDGSLVRLLGHNADSTAWRVESFNAPGEWEVPHKYVKPIKTTRFDKVVMVDLTNQDIATLERGSAPGKWLVRSMNPCTTGTHQPPHAYPTPPGMFVIQDRIPKMMYNNGGPVIVGFAPWASRFTNGAFLHGVPVNNPSGAIVEYSTTLGTIPRSHECVRNASSHAKFIYDWALLEASLVFVYN